MTDSNAAQIDIVGRAMRDAEFRAALLRDPKGTLAREYGVTTPVDVELTVLEASDKHKYVILPPAQESLELSDEELEQLAAAVGSGCTLHCRIGANTGSWG
jgi:hypothetical protein